MKPEILVTYRIPKEGIQELEEKFDVIYPEKEAFSMEDIEERIVGCDADLSVFIRPVTAELMACTPKLKIIANFGIGYNNIDVAEATRRGIAVCNTPNAVTGPTAEMALGLMLAVMRRITETRIETAREASQNIIGFFSGRKDISIVNPEIFA
jgi:glyoxylate reductase